MSRKDYVLLSRVIKEVITSYNQRGEWEYLTGAEKVAFALSKVLAIDNSRFEVRRFIKACGITVPE